MLTAVLLLLAACAGPAQGLGSFVHCEPCDEKALSMCPPSPFGLRAGQGAGLRLLHDLRPGGGAVVRRLH